MSASQASRPDIMPVGRGTAATQTISVSPFGGELRDAFGPER